jgi:hypothetical protein
MLKPKAVARNVRKQERGGSPSPIPKGHDIRIDGF